MNLGSLLHAKAAETPHKTALYSGFETMSYLTLDETSTRLAEWFLAQDLRAGERVALHWSNSFEVVQLFFALFKAGLIAVTVNIRLKPPEIRRILDHSQARICFSEPALASQAEQAGAKCPIFTQLPLSEPTCPRPTRMPDVDPDQPAVILYTSGTTAHPKGVIHTHRSLFHTAEITARGLLDQSEIMLPMTQLMHGSAFNGALLPSIYLGATVILLSGFDPAAILDTIERFGSTCLIGLPALIQYVVEAQARKPRRVGSLRAALAGGDTVSVALQDRFETLFGIPLQEVYGMTEALPITVNPKGALRPGSLGLLQEGFEVRIVDLDGRDVCEGETGEIVVRSAANCIGYWNDTAATEAAFKDGSLHTGDLACRDADGYYWFKGRKKQIIIRDGSNISPQEVEEVLYQHAAVLEAGVVGWPHPVHGEQVVAFVALRNGETVTEEILRDFARQRLADYKVPERIIFLEVLPKGPTGKVHRRALKEMLSVPASAY